MSGMQIRGKSKSRTGEQGKTPARRANRNKKWPKRISTILLLHQPSILPSSIATIPHAAANETSLCSFQFQRPVVNRDRIAQLLQLVFQQFRLGRLRFVPVIPSCTGSGISTRKQFNLRKLGKHAVNPAVDLLRSLLALRRPVQHRSRTGGRRNHRHLATGREKQQLMVHTEVRASINQSFLRLVAIHNRAMGQVASVAEDIKTDPIA